ncbi:oxidoreductase [Carbonactinospora thermoautotrophica]|uniref:NAD(P)/FAD-dependent oxidoreductase n=1 Tax=Carbonactinospora thermoautotrophica TaxID=1469144 RepID=UPI00099E476A|nr:FAD-dependent oxidoreductase [Carbonactinospora thermoautotrophica]MCX9190803.1 oxidoreductase [Carbonactinospora thermoautotrophica]
MENVVVVGAGLAGLQTVVALRQQGYAGRLTLLGAEPHPPYDRPPLSKDVLAGKVEDTTLEADWAALDVTLQLGCRATGLCPGHVETEAGPVPYDGLVIATGADPVRLPGPGSVLRTIEDARALRQVLRPGRRVVVVGAGWLGAEVATTAAGAGCAVTVVEALDTPLAGVLPAEVGRHFTPWYAAAGVELLLGESVAAVEPGAVRLATGVELPADHVVVGIGVRPATGWLAGSGVPLDARGAVVTDEYLRAGLPGVYAVGDCVTWPSRRYGVRMHVEHWDNALHAPAVAAANLLGDEVRYDPVPYFWSEQFGRVVQYAGHHPAGDRLVWRGDPAGETWAACWLSGDRLVAILTVDRPRDLAQARRILDRDALVDADRLADPDLPLKAAAR